MSRNNPATLTAKDLILEVLAVGPLGVNCVILARKGSHGCLVVDPGDETKRILAACKKHELAVELILLTHGHFDHVLGATELRAATNADICLCAADQPLYEGAAEHAAGYGLSGSPTGPWQRELKDGEILSAGGLELEVIHTPGHSPGSVCFRIAEFNLVLSGDTLFAGGVGRTDVWGGSQKKLLASIQRLLAAIPESTEIIPGHGPRTTAGHEWTSNPFLDR